MASTKKLKLTDLQVNTENYRFEPVGSQKEAIDKMLEDQDEKLYALAEHILLNGLNPNDRIQVVPSSHDSSKYNVVEGNRRTVSLKLLSAPDLIEGSHKAALKRKFKKLHDANKSALVKVVECTVYDNPAEADKWIKLKHAGQLDGIGIVSWNAQQIDRFEEKVEGKSSVALQAIKLLEKSSDFSSTLKTQLPNLKITNLERLISDPKVREFLGIEIDNGVIQSEVEPKEVIKGLAHIVGELLNPKFNVKKIYTKEDRQDFIKTVPNVSKPNLKKKAAKPWRFTGVASPTSIPTPKPKPNPKNRDVLIPKSCQLKINNPKVNSLYHELQKLTVSKFANVAAVAFRVFVENSMDCYIESNKLSTTKEGKPLSKESYFIVKIIEVANDLEGKKAVDKHICKGIRSAVTNKNDLLGVETLHAYVHNAKFSAIPTNMIITWDNIQTFMEKVWDNIK